MGIAGYYTFSAKGDDWERVSRSLKINEDQTAKYDEMDVADRDTHDEAHYEGFVKVEGKIVTFFQKKRESRSNYDNPTTSEGDAKAIQRFLVLEDGNIGLLKYGSDSEIREQHMGYAGTSVGKVIMTKT
mmetsp:Transcript_16468/g.32942  ORF Transcript_16468/g.32942 Transcript_16468/m.32942 type:complete len:129 (-) Transcript_16468:134-520(-)|eukprot:CAMPEP_0181320730 /NCGR_PEP_ID=MMETSP1101-20121128/18284_1 /TAXON_ID=46948 /ORGANISM="Rhodomonas abbreviata, Strain Caron Lab Isolate" /LENGTH=128 /DNA_ID=CAMNT_0023428463 /DNA_START=149 /DNA_END=535 /DNA_ORIENTATION=-